MGSKCVIVGARLFGVKKTVIPALDAGIFWRIITTTPAMDKQSCKKTVIPG